MKLKYIETNSKDLDFIKIIRGQVLYCKDNRKVYYDNEKLNRININLNVFILNSIQDRDSIVNPLINKVYLTIDTGNLYSFDGFRWGQITLEEELYNTISSLTEFVSGVIAKDGHLYAPATLASTVYMKDGTRLSASLSSRLLTVTKTKAVYVEAEQNGQRVFIIPYPINDYDFKENHMSVLVRGELLNPSDYVINNDKLLLNQNIEGLNVSETILLIFYYTEHIDLNQTVLLKTQNYADKSITSEKLSDSIRINAYNIVETIDKIFFTPEEKEKLKNIEDNATCYHHPATHPATMIETDKDHEFVTDNQITEWDNKANSNDVYTKSQVDQLIANLIGSAAENLDTLGELSKALGNDENFSTTVLEKISEKASKKELKELSNVVNTKVNIDDYVRSPIYGTPSKINKKNGSYFTLNVSDPNFREYMDGMQVILKMNDKNIGDSFLAINNLEYKHIVTVEGYDLIEGELLPNSIYSLRYNGTTGNFILQGKGGVKIRNTSLESYLVKENDSRIIRGDVIDIEDGKVMHSIPRARVLSNYETNEDKYKSEENIELYKIDNNRFIIFWKFKKLLQAEVISLTNGFIDVSPLVLKKPITISEDCITYKVDTMENGKYILSYADSKNIVTTQIVSINADSAIILDTAHTQDESELISNINIIYIKNNRAIIAWEYGNKTRCLLISTEGNKINVISGRDNIEYPLDSYCLINPTQILFTSSKGKYINAWIMAISDNDFANSTVVDIVTSKNSTFVTPTLTLISKNQVLSEWTDVDKNNFYRQYIEIDYKGGIQFSEPKTIDTENYRIQSEIIPAQKRLYDDYFVAPSNMNYNMPSALGGSGDKCIKITVSKIDYDSYNTLSTHTSITKVTADNIAFDMMGDYMIIAYNTKINKTDDTHLFFAVADIRKIPYGIAISCANPNELVSISKW